MIVMATIFFNIRLCESARNQFDKYGVTTNLRVGEEYKVGQT